MIQSVFFSMVISKKIYKSPVLSLFTRLVRCATGSSARGTAHAGNGFPKNPPLFHRNMKPITVTMVSCSMLAAACNKGQRASSAPEHVNQMLAIGRAPGLNRDKQVSRYEPLSERLPSAQGLGIDVHSGSDAPAR
jgi:hypothetical protein